MNIVVINGTEKHGVTFQLKELFLDRFRKTAHITEYFLPRDCPDFCRGCTGCILHGEETCKDREYIRKIEQSLLEAHLIVFTSPAYVMHATGAMKNLLDHFAYRWMPHRPAAAMFSKRAVLITQCLGAGAGSAATDMKHSLSWWGISRIGVFSGALLSEVVWDRLPPKRKRRLTAKIGRLAEKFSRIDYARPARASVGTKFKFAFCRLMQKKLYRQDPNYPDAGYWHKMGWLGAARPWKRK